METQTLDIPVVWPEYYEDCEQCLERLKEALECLHGMRSVNIQPDRRTLEVSYAKDLLTFETIRETARELGVTLAERFRHERIRLAGLDCPDCALKLEAAIGRMPGVGWASVNYATSVLIVEYEPDRTSIAAVERRIRELGYDVEAAKPAGPEPAKPSPMRGLRTALTALSGVLMAGGLAIEWAAGGRMSTAPLFVLSAVLGGAFALRTAYYSLRAFSLDTNFLMTAAAAGAIALGDYAEAAAVMFLFSLGATLEALTVDKARRSIRALIEAFPASASVRRNGRVLELPLDEIEIGDIVSIRPGEKVPVDGTVVEGESSVSEAPITGEPVPKEKRKGDAIYAGSINGSGALEVRVTNRAEDNTLARIVHLVEEAQAQKAPSQRFSETFGRYYTPC
ncbi:MAG: cation transporter, partial [Armatimonadota bacterium]